MRALVVLAHYFSAEANPRHSSVDESRRENRRKAVETVIQGYRGLFGTTSKLRFADRSLDILPASVDLDIRVLTVPGCSLVTPEFRKAYGVWETAAMPENPRMLGFSASHIFAKLSDQYDWFVFSEDDLLVRDPLFFDKLVWFNATFGDRRVLSPNRLEWNPAAKRLKTYVDGDLSQDTFTRLTRALPDEDVLVARPFLREQRFSRARNPHSGFYAITKAQLAHWMAQPHWLDYDVSFVTPLESAATLGLTKTFGVYKPADDAPSFLEVEHLDDRFSKGPWPIHQPAMAAISE